MKKIRVRYIVLGLLLFISFIVLTSLRWCYNTFGPLSMDQLLFTVIAPVDGYDNSMLISWLTSSLALSILFTVIITVGILVLFKKLRHHYHNNKVIHYLDKYIYILGIVTILASLILTNNQFNVINYFTTSNQSTTIFEEKKEKPKKKKEEVIEPTYVNPSSITYDDTDSNNLIYIYLESMENTFMSVDQGGTRTINVIPELTDLANNNISFSNNDKLGGSIAFTGTTWTIASMVAQSSGLPLKVEVANDMNKYANFMPGATMIGDILASKGYTQELLLGSSSTFAGTDKMFRQHGNYNIVDYKTLKNEGRVQKGDYNEWGIDDHALVREAKTELTNIAATGTKFNFTMATIDAHAPRGLPCSDCPKNFEDRYYNVNACQSKLIGDFVVWIQEQPWYKNTTIVIVGDHNSMADPSLYSSLPEGYVRTTYNCIINSKVTTTNIKNRQFCQLDMFPTTLAAMGLKANGNRAGLGTNLFSKAKTNLELNGYDYFNNEVSKQSQYLDENIYQFTGS